MEKEMDLWLKNFFCYSHRDTEKNSINTFYLPSMIENVIGL